MGSPAVVSHPRQSRGRRPGPQRPPRPVWRSLLDIAIFAFAATIVLLAVHVFNRVTVTPGNVDIIDGDSFRRGEVEIRLYGIDAPEYRQTCRDENGRDWNCGREAARALRDLVSRRTVECTGFDADRYGRLVSRCTVGRSEERRVGKACGGT